MASLSTHVLDTSTGRPAVGLRVTLESAGGPAREAVTDADGRVGDLAPVLATGEHRIRFDRPVGARDYLDGFGNTITRLLAPEGRLVISKDILVRDPGTPDPAAPDAEQHAVEDLPEHPLLRSVARTLAAGVAGAATD